MSHRKTAQVARVDHNTGTTTKVGKPTTLTQAAKTARDGRQAERAAAPKGSTTTTWKVTTK